MEDKPTLEEQGEDEQALEELEEDEPALEEEPGEQRETAPGLRLRQPSGILPPTLHTSPHPPSVHPSIHPACIHLSIHPCHSLS